MKTKNQTKTRKTLRKAKEATKLVLFFAVPVAIILVVLIQGGTFNAF